MEQFIHCHCLNKCSIIARRNGNSSGIDRLPLKQCAGGKREAKPGTARRDPMSLTHRHMAILVKDGWPCD